MDAGDRVMSNAGAVTEDAQADDYRDVGVGATQDAKAE
jgi:hypothetical protein